MVDHYQIRRATSADLTPILAIEQAVFSDPWTRSAFVELSHALMLVAVTETTVVGYLVARQMADEAEILNVAVHPSHRLGGLGSSLMRQAVESLARDGTRQVYLEVRETNQDARAFYHRLGFEEVGRRRKYYQKPVEDALILALRLNPETGPASIGT